MRRFNCISLFLLFASVQQISFADKIQSGIAVVDITPPEAFRMSGYFSERLSTGTKDPLKAKAIVFQQEDQSAAIVFCDLIGIPLAVSQKARQLAESQTGVPASNIAITATHSHTGPLYFGALREHFRQRSIRTHGKDIHEQNNFANMLVARIVEAVQKAKAKLQTVELRSGYGTENTLAFNRRFLMKDGTVRFNPGQQNPRIVRSVGTIDPQVGIISLSRPNTTNPHAAIISYALHLDTVGGTEYSADYPKYLQDGLRKSMDPNFISLFGAGTCGDINHIDVTIKGRRSSPQIGSILAKSVSKTFRSNSLRSITKPHLAVRSGTIKVALQTYSPDEIGKAQENMDLVDSRKLSFLERVHAYKVMALQLRGGVTMPIEVQAFQLDHDTAIVTLPGEVFVDLGLAIKQASPFKTTLVLELTNDAPGYLPTRKAFAEGSYETVNSRIAPGGAEEMVELAVKLLHSLPANKTKL